MEFKFDDGGREKYFKGTTGDCVVRAIAIATGIDYKEVYDLVNEFSKNEVKSKRKKRGSSSRTGVHKDVTRNVMKHLGWEWVPTMQIGSGCTVHLKADELPKGTLIVSVSKHLVCVKDGIIHDTHDCSRDGSRCVYGYFRKGVN